MEHKRCPALSGANINGTVLGFLGNSDSFRFNEPLAFKKNIGRRNCSKTISKSIEMVVFYFWVKKTLSH